MSAEQNKMHLKRQNGSVLPPVDIIQKCFAGSEIMAHLLKSTVNNPVDDTKGRFLTFQVDEEMFGIELKDVMEIVGIQSITRMPEMPDYIKGIINLREKIIPVMDVRLRFRMPETAYNDRTCIIVIDYGNVSIGLIVDSVSEVLTIPDKDIAEKPEISFYGSCGYINNIGKIGEKIVLLIDCGKLLNEEAFDTVPAQL